MLYISLADFKTRNNILSDKFDAQLTALLEDFSGIIDEETKSIFTLSTKTSADEMRFPGQPAGVNYVKIRAWQADANFVVKKGSFGSSEELKTLVKNVDYYPQKVDGNPENPIYQLKFVSELLFASQFVQIEGNYGFSAGLPSKLKLLLEQAVLTALNARLRGQTQLTKGGGQSISSERSGNLSVTFGGNPEMEKYASDLASGNLLAVPSIAGTLNKYKFLFTENCLTT